MPVVSLYVYDLSMGAAKAMSTALIGKQIGAWRRAAGPGSAGELHHECLHPDGIWHTGVEVFGQEYFFGGGIQVLPHSAVVRAPRLRTFLGAFPHAGEFHPRFSVGSFQAAAHGEGRARHDHQDARSASGVPV